MENKEQTNDLVKELKEAMRLRKVKFSYRKKDGTIRDAVGTLNADIYGNENKPTGAYVVIPENQVRYFDIDKQGWRSFLSENLISYES